MPADPIFLNQGVDYLGFLNAKLRDLKGWSTLINELVQNADDAEGATELTVEITDEALIVGNNAVFKDCGSIDARDCPWGTRSCDFHSFRRVASGHKRNEENTTGAFGLGFISVYQITDHPCLESGDWTWKLDPAEIETKRIEAVRRNQRLNATRFTLPWAFTKSRVREELAQPLVTRVDLDRLPEIFATALRAAAPFLRRLQALELLRSGTRVAVVTRESDPSANDLLVDNGESAQLWRRLVGSFDSDAAALRARHGAGIEDKRSSEVALLVPHGELPADGLLYAYLPTQHRIALPVLINADFFPSSDRKRILFDDDYQGQWNSAAIRASAEALASALPDLRDLLTPQDLWRIIDDTRSLGREVSSGRAAAPFAAFWDKAGPVVRTSSLVFTSRGEWHPPADVRLLQKPDEEAEALPALEALKLPIADAVLRKHWSTLQECGVRELTAEDIIRATQAEGLGGPLEEAACPAWLMDGRVREGLVGELFRLLARVPQGKRPQIDCEIRQIPVCQTTVSCLAPISATRVATHEAQELFKGVPGLYWLGDGCPEVLKNEVAALRAGDLESWLPLQTGLDPALPAEPQLAHSAWVLDWVLERTHEWAEFSTFRVALGGAVLWPSGGELKSLNELYVPGSFEDPLGLATLLEGAIVEKWRRELVGVLGAKVLELDTYLKDLVPRRFAADQAVSSDVRRSLVGLVIENIGGLQDRADVANALSGCSLVECQDGEFRPAPEVYFDEEVVWAVLGKEVPVAAVDRKRPEAHRSALAWLGVAARPRSQAIVARVKELTAGVVDETSREAIREVIRGLSSEWNHYFQHAALNELRVLSWLPAAGSSSWQRPRDVFSVFRKQVFSSVGPFLDVERGAQQSETGAKLLEFLGVSSEPTVAMVIKHLRNVIARGEQPHPDVYRFLSETKEPQLLASLKTVACLWSGGRFYRPDATFLEEHPFGGRRFTLDRDWLKYAQLLRALDVKTVPDAADARAVLLEIETDYTNNLPLGEGDFLIVFSCWQVISDSLNSLNDPWFKDLRDRRVVPNAARLLTKPTWLFFRDRPRLAEPFGDLLVSNVIDRPSGSAPALMRAGVRPLSAAVEIDLVERDDAEVATDIEGVLGNRLPLIRRILESSPLTQLSEDVLATPSVYWVTRLEVLYRVFLGDRYFPSPAPIEVSAYLNRSDQRLYIDRRTRAWQTEVARELAFAAIPDASAAHLAAVVEVILQASNIGEAAERLDDLGFAPADVQIEAPTVVPPLDAPNEVSADATADGEQVEGGEGRTGGQSGTEQGQAPETPEPADATEGGGGASGGRKGSTKSSGSSKSSSRGALRSYVVTEEMADRRKPLSDEAKARRAMVDRAGVASVMRHELTAGRTPVEMDHHHEGYDVESNDTEGMLDRVIEVKSLSGLWSGDGAKVSPAQFRCAQERGDQFWLYVVESAGQPEERIHRIQNPAGRVDEFRFDDGWEVVSEGQPVVRPRSILDLPNPEKDSGAVGPGDFSPEVSPSDLRSSEEMES